MTVKRKSIPRQIAEHFGCDMDDVRDASYQHGHWTPAVFIGFTGDGAYWSAGPRQPRHKDGENGTDHPVRALAAECDHAAHPIQVFASAE
jgi:hypothetical protein